MSFLARERESLQSVLPGFDGVLAVHPLADLERADGTAIKLLRKTRAAALLVPSECGGLGAAPLTAIRVQRAIGARAPSLAVATTMHHFSIATLLQYSLYAAEGRMMLGLVAAQGFLVASGFAEGRANQSILEATVRAEWTGSSYRLKGSKKPCSLSRSMDLLSAGVTVIRGNLPPARGVAVVLASMPGLVRKPFWHSPVLAATESDEVVLDGIEIPPDSLITFDANPAGAHPIEIGGLIWFTLMISSAYLGIASGLVERVLRHGKGGAGERVAMVGELESSMCALEGLAARMATDPLDAQLLGHAQLIRYSVQDAIQRATSQAVEALGGMSFIASEDVGYMLAASRALAFHPPSRASALTRLAAALDAGNETEAGSHVAA